MSVVEALVDQLDAEVHWISRSDFSPMLSTHPGLSKIWSYQRETGLIGLFKMMQAIRCEKFDYIYDAHQNIRSFLVRLMLGFPSLQRHVSFSIRRKYRFQRLLFFQLGMKCALPRPFRAMVSFQKPLKKWGLNFSKTYTTDWTFTADVVEKGERLLCTILDEGKVITIVPSAAWKLKRWPVAYWCELVRKMPDYRFIIIAGPDDIFTQEIEKIDPKRVFNMAGKTTLQESFYIINRSQMVVSADTGFLHAADLFRINAIALIGPTAFGYPTGSTVQVIEVDDLKCRPCTKAGNTKCKMPGERRACLLDIKPRMVVDRMREIFGRL